MRHTNRWLTTFILLLFVGSGLMAQKKSLPCLNKEFSVVAHVVKNEGDSLGLVVDSLFAVLDRVNNLFDPICVSFKICEVNIIENWQYDTVQTWEWDEMQVVYHQQKKINIFWVAEFEFPDDLCGHTDLGGIANLESGGILTKKGDCINEFAIAHDLGRFFGVPWTFGEGEQQTDELVRGQNCDIAGDQICDTPADPYRLGDDVEQYVDAGNNCRFIDQKRDSEQDWYTPHVGNIMSYYPDECKCQFSDEQYRLMVATYLATDPRMW